MAQRKPQRKPKAPPNPQPGSTPGPSRTKRCFLLELPPELRNRIYMFHAQTGVAWLPYQTAERPLRRMLISKSALVHTNKQIRHEYLDILHFNVCIIRPIVINCDFGHVIKFLRLLPEEAIESLVEGTSKSTRMMVIDLELHDVTGREHVQLLRRWAQCARDLGKVLNIRFVLQDATSEDTASEWDEKIGEVLDGMAHRQPDDPEVYALRGLYFATRDTIRSKENKLSYWVVIDSATPDVGQLYLP